MKTTIYTIGHSSHPIDSFIGLLKQNGIVLVADVRSIPSSRHNPQFNRDTLRRSLDAAGIDYIPMGNALGAMTDNPNLMENGCVSFAKIAASSPFKTGLSRVADLAGKHRLALMCAEKDPLSCHRTMLVSRHLEKTGADIWHILEDGTRESHGNTMTRLLKASGLPEEDFFLSRENLVDQAITRWEEKMLKKRG